MSHFSHAPGPAACRRPSSEPVVVVPGGRVCPRVPRLPVTSVDGRLPDRTGDVALPDVARIVPGAVAGNLASLTGRGNPADSGIPSDAARQAIAKAGTAYQKPEDGIPGSDLSEGVRTSLGKADSAYQLPGTGIPKSDLSGGVQASLDKADSAYQLPGTGIPKSHLSEGVQASLGLADTALQEHQDVSGKADKAAGATPGDLAGLDRNGNLTDSGIPAAAIPAGAGASDPLATRSFVNSSIQTNTATFRGTYNLAGDLSLAVGATHEQVAAAIAAKLASLVPPVVPENNDYCFVQVPYDDTPVDPDHIERVDRYKCSVAESGGATTRTWAYEWSLNNSSFTAAQWAAINSGITSGAVAKLDGIAAGAQVNVIEAVKVNGTALTPDESKAVDITYDNAVTYASTNSVKSSGIWSMLWGAFGIIPGGFSSVYDWVIYLFRLKRDLTDMACTADVAGIPQIGSGKFIVTSPSGTSTTLTPFESGNIRGWGWYTTYPYIYVRASNSYDIIFGLGISDIISLNMTAKTQTVTYNGATWRVDAFTGATVNTRLANMTDIPAASTSTPLMDGTGAAGTSATYARGDHVHPTDTSRMAASATGADIAVSGTDATKVDAALAGKASKSDATLTPIYSDTPTYSEWDVEPATATINGQTYTLFVFDKESGGVRYWWLSSSTSGTPMAVRPYDPTATSLAFTLPDGFSPSSVVATRTRTDILGYRLGPDKQTNPNRDKPLASEAEAEALRTNVAGKYTKPETGIPKIDLAEGIQASLDKADTAPIVLDVAHHSRITVGDVEFEVVLYWNSGARDRFFMAAQRVGTWLTQSGEWQSSAEAYTHTWESGGVTYTATRAAGNYFTPVYINGVESSLNNIASRCAGQDLGTTAEAFYDTLNAYFAICDGDGNRISDTYARKASPGHAGNLAALDASGNPTDSGVKPSDKLDSTSAAPAFSTSSTYAVGDHVTYNGALYRCTTAVTTAGTWTGSTNWTADTMTDPDAVLDITAQNQLRVVAKDGTLLWAQGYDLASTSSATLACDACNNFTFADGATSQAFTLPTAPSGKIGDFGLDIDNSANASAATMTLTGLDTTFSIVVPKGESLNDMLSIAARELARFYITLSTFRVNNLPTWHIVKQIVENGGATV